MKYLTLLAFAACVGGCDDAQPVGDPPIVLPDAMMIDEGLVDQAVAIDMQLDSAVDMAPDMAPEPVFVVDCDSVPETTVDVVDLGTLNLGGMVFGVPIEVPDNAISLTVVMVEENDQAMMVVTHLIDPDGTAWVSPMPEGYTPSARDRLLGPFPGGFYSPNRSTASATGAGALLLPNNPSVRIMPGEWTVLFSAASIATGQEVQTDARVQVLIKRAERLPTCGRLPVHLYFTGSSGWTAESAPDDPGFQRALDRMRGFYAGVGITLDPITYDDVPDPPEEVDATGGPGSGMHQLFAQNDYDDGVALFFVPRLTSPFGGGVGGVSGGIPGPTLQANTPRSGVVVATELDPDPDAIGHIMGHESGHFLGLFHTIEFIGVQDQIEDTTPSQRDMSNLMFPTVTSGEAMLSPGQGWVLHHNASVIAEVP